MAWLEFSLGLRLDPIGKASPEALVVLLHDFGDAAATLTCVAARWATTVPTTAFIAFDRIDQLHSPSEPAELDRVTRHLEPLLEQQLRVYRLDASRLVLVGFGYGGTLALHMLLHQGVSCVGVLAFAATLARPLPRVLRVARKVRLIECTADRHIGHGSLRDVVALLTARGIDTRGVLLAGSVLSDQAIRHGGAYLVELVATAHGVIDTSSIAPAARSVRRARRHSPDIPE